MDLVIFADKHLQERGYLPYAEGDFTIGRNNTFELKVSPDYGIAQDSYLMIEGTEYGGIVDDIECDTTQDYITVSGRTWHGILEHSLVKPNAGQTHLVLSGECNAIIKQLIERQQLGFCMVASTDVSGFTVSNWEVSRLGAEMNVYAVIRSMLRSVGAKLRITYDGGKRKAVLSAVPQGSFVDDGVDGDKQNFVIKQTRPVNHLHCMGVGQGTSRVILDLYANEKGEISQTQSLFGSQHIEDVYESNNSEYDDLKEQGTKQLQDMQKSLNSCSLVEAGKDIYDIDDIVGATSTRHGVSIVTTIAQKEAHITGDNTQPIQITTKTALEVS